MPSQASLDLFVLLWRSTPLLENVVLWNLPLPSDYFLFFLIRAPRGPTVFLQVFIINDVLFESGLVKAVDIAGVVYGIYVGRDAEPGGGSSVVIRIRVRVSGLNEHTIFIKLDVGRCLGASRMVRASRMVLRSVRQRGPRDRIHVERYPDPHVLARSPFHAGRWGSRWGCCLPKKPRYLI